MVDYDIGGAIDDESYDPYYYIHDNDPLKQHADFVLKVLKDDSPLPGIKPQNRDVEASYSTASQSLHLRPEYDEGYQKTVLHELMHFFDHTDQPHGGKINNWESQKIGYDQENMEKVLGLVQLLPQDNKYLKYLSNPIERLAIQSTYPYIKDEHVQVAADRILDFEGSIKDKSNLNRYGEEYYDYVDKDVNILNLVKLVRDQNAIGKLDSYLQDKYFSDYGKELFKKQLW